jgi:hypothetical protein
VAKRKEEKDEPLNLVPIMNLVTILIPALLIAIKAVTLTMIETKLPAIGPAAPPTAVEDNQLKPLSLQIIVGTKGITFNKPSLEFAFDGEVPPEYKSENPPPLLPCAGGSCFNACEEDKKQKDMSCFNYDFEEFIKKFVFIKQKAIQENRFEETSQNLVLMPEKDIPYIVLIHTMDAARGSQEEQAIFENNSEVYKKGLFTMISFAGGLN